MPADLANGWTDLQGAATPSGGKGALPLLCPTKGKLNVLHPGADAKPAESNPPTPALLATSPLGLPGPCGFEEANPCGSCQQQFAAAGMQLHPMLRS